eukprot:CAMPEP_0172188816 /NCGR_PEP_ID=MMETSP1050-20130122/22166_1 /TAXON_ID=233186 /ORGANISM="Cryptomonas curvata, Strain CCAP979/52" /LENGTH=119 /DNA_ID=CAMNT_0012863417 /DNA_START=3984 /DNA_END=4340 /DNA_ORIENTATION=-
MAITPISTAATSRAPLHDALRLEVSRCPNEMLVELGRQDSLLGWQDAARVEGAGIFNPDKNVAVFAATTKLSPRHREAPRSKARRQMRRQDAALGAVLRSTLQGQRRPSPTAIFAHSSR